MNRTIVYFGIAAFVALARPAGADPAEQAAEKTDGPFYGPQWDKARIAKYHRALEILDKAGEIAFDSHFYSPYYSVKIPFYRDRPAQPTKKDLEAIQESIDALRRDHVKRNATIAWEKLVGIGTPAVPHLIRALESADDQQRTTAASALGRIGGDDAIAALIAQLKDDKISHNALAAYFAFAEIGPPALPALRDATQSVDRQQSTFAKCLITFFAEDTDKK